MLNDIQKEKLSDEELDRVSGGVNITTNLLYNNDQENYQDDLVASGKPSPATYLLEKDPKFRKRRTRKKKRFDPQNGGLQSL